MYETEAYCQKEKENLLFKDAQYYKKRKQFK